MNIDHSVCQILGWGAGNASWSVGMAMKNPSTHVHRLLSLGICDNDDENIRGHVQDCPAHFHLVSSFVHSNRSPEKCWVCTPFLMAHGLQLREDRLSSMPWNHLPSIVWIVDLLENAASLDKVEQLQSCSKPGTMIRSNIGPYVNSFTSDQYHPGFS